MNQGTTEMAELVAVQTWIEREIAEKLKALAQVNERSLAAELRLAIKAYLEQHS